MAEMQTDDCLYISTSNAARKYFTDALTVLAWPRGWVAHFRYQLLWVQEELAEQLPLRGATIENPLKGKRVVACYLFQTRRDAKHWERHAIYLLRYRKVVEAYKVGAGKYDIAHFYFAMDGYAVPADSDSAALSPEDFLPPNYHAALGPMIGVPTSAAQDESACQSLIESIRMEHLTLQPDSEKLDLIEQVYPVVPFVRGVKEQQRTIAPQFDHSDRRAYYELKERHEYVLDCSFHVPSWCAAPAPGSKVSLEYDEKAFVSAAKSQMPMESRYDEYAWLVVPAATETEVRRELTLRTDIRAPDGVEVTNVDLAIPVKIRPSKFLRARYIATDLLGDVGLAVGTVAFTLSRLPNPPLAGEATVALVVGGYAGWLLFKLVARLWKL